MDSGLTTDQAVSADGKFIAYASDRSGDGNLDIWVRQVAGGEPARLTTDPADDHEPSFSPDGSRIAFRSERDGGGIYVVSTLGGDARRIFDRGRRPRWSPDGARIACWAGPDLAFLMDKADAPRIYVLPASGGEPQRLFSDFAVAWAPIWSADSRSLLFAGSREAAPRSVTDWWAGPVDGGSPRATGAYARIRTGGLSPSPETVFLPEAWGSDGQVLFPRGWATAPTSGRSTCHTVNPRTVRLNGSRPGRFEIHPSATSGGTLVFSAVSRTSTSGVCRPTRSKASSRVPCSVSRRIQPPRRTHRRRSTAQRSCFSPTDLRLRPLAPGHGQRQGRRDGRERVFRIADRHSMDRASSSRTAQTASVERSFRQSLANVRALSNDLRGPRSFVDLSADGRWRCSPRASTMKWMPEKSRPAGRALHEEPWEIKGRLDLPDDRWVAFAHRSSGNIRLVVAPFRPGALGP